MPNNITVQNIPVGSIKPSPMNPRKSFPLDALNELAESISRQGLLQPITVRPLHTAPSGFAAGGSSATAHDAPPATTAPSGFAAGGPSATAHDAPPAATAYEIVCGERRYRACVMLHIGTIPCIVRDLSDEEAFDAMITENLQRNDVDPIEEAEAFRILSERGQKTDELAARFGKSASYVRGRISLCKLSSPLREALSRKLLTIGGAVLLSRLAEKEQNGILDEWFDTDEDGTYIFDVDDDDAQITLDNARAYIRRIMMNLWNAPFQDGSTLEEAWNPDGAIIRRCDTCECNSSCRMCLFPEMQSKEPRCCDRKCYDRKSDIFYLRYIEQNRPHIVKLGEEPGSSSIVLLNDSGETYLSSEVRERAAQLSQQYQDKGFRVFSPDELGGRIWMEKDVREARARGEAVRAISLTRMAHRRSIDDDVYYRLPTSADEATVPSPSGEAAGVPDSPASASGSSPAGNSKAALARQLADRKNTIASQLESDINAQLRKHFNPRAYIEMRTALSSVETDLLGAILFYKAASWVEKKALNPAFYSHNPHCKELLETLQRDNNRFYRSLIADFLDSWGSLGFTEHLMHDIAAPLTRATVTPLRKEADGRIRAIIDELRDMGYDENGQEL